MFSISYNFISTAVRNPTRYYYCINLCMLLCCECSDLQNAYPFLYQLSYFFLLGINLGSSMYIHVGANRDAWYSICTSSAISCYHINVIFAHFTIASFHSDLAMIVLISRRAPAIKWRWGMLPSLRSPGVTWWNWTLMSATEPSLY